MREKTDGKYHHLVCPISQLVMQDPVQTQCKHCFDRLCICMNIMKDNRCPVCRHVIEVGGLRSVRKLKA